ncbi:RluA family pseudouridine synthase [Intestinimonas sp.]|uniref:RluA family pseudouridine synthase n=1 Tax=Intestinimonas sp. TaxID=1965293 RepID=UPI002611E56D|nr:RluA family pseudouridine synthase [Intestinimonas sp.]
MGTEKQVRRLSLTVPPERAGQKVDTLLRKVLGLSGTVIRRIKWLEDGILLDGVRVFTSQRVEGGQVLTVRLSDPERRSGVTPAPGPLDIVYEDGDLLVLNKAPGVLVHPGAGHFPDTIGNFLLDYYDKAGIEADFHPVHRLDKGTSGLMVVAKHPHAQEVLKNQLHTAEFRRIYLAVCLGGPAEEAGTVDAPIGMAEGSIVARAVRPDGLPARTHYQVLRRVGDRALVRLALETGRTHQIRVHMAHLGCPLAGDFLYGTEDKDLVPRPALHSSELTIRQPVTGEVLTFTCPLPGDMAHLIELET